MQKDERFIPLNEAENYFKTSWQTLAQGALALEYFLYYRRRGQIFVVHPASLEDLYNGISEVTTKHHVKTKNGNILPHKCFYKELCDSSSSPKRSEEFLNISLDMLAVRMSDENKIFHYLRDQHDADLSVDECLRRVIRYLELADGKDPSKKIGQGGNSAIKKRIEKLKRNYYGAIGVCIAVMVEAAGQGVTWEKIKRTDLISRAEADGLPGLVGRDIHKQIPRWMQGLKKSQ